VAWRPGRDYTAKFGTSGITYTYITNDDQALEKGHLRAGSVRSDAPRATRTCPTTSAGASVQPFDTSLIPSFKQLNPYLVKHGARSTASNYMIPWDWGYGSLTYRTDHVSNSDATGW